MSVDYAQATIMLDDVSFADPFTELIAKFMRYPAPHRCLLRPRMRLPFVCDTPGNGGKVKLGC
jgi:hypothetical protein